MSEAKFALLADRGVVGVTGEDAGRFLQGLVTNDMDLVSGEQAIFAGLLSPQGKILFEFFVVADADGYLLDVARDRAGELVKRLAMYKLRAKVELAIAQKVVHALWPIGAVTEHLLIDAVQVRDPRDPRLGARLIGGFPDISCTHARGEPADYDAHRIDLGIPDGGRDYDFGDTFPHEANFDLNHGVSFGKGCYVGQEIVARMQHKTVVRKRVVRVEATSDLPRGRPEITAGTAGIGRLGSVAGRHGLALLRLDRVSEAQEKGEPIMAGDVALTVDPVLIDRHRASVAARTLAP